MAEIQSPVVHKKTIGAFANAGRIGCIPQKLRSPWITPDSPLGANPRRPCPQNGDTKG